MDRAPDAAVPVFPLPELVAFPLVPVPLRVFELRYRTMVRDALSRGRVLALATLCPGYEQDYHGSPAFHDLGCLVRIEQVEWLPNDHYELVVVGTTRVRFRRIVSEFPYRSARIEPLPQHPYAEDDPIVGMEKQALVERWGRLRAALAASAPAPVGLGAEPPAVGADDAYERVVNVACAWCPATSAERLTLLERDSVLERGMLARALLDRVVEPAPPRPGPGPAEGGERN